MKLKLFTLIAFSGLFLCANAQTDLIKKIQKENVVKGVIIQQGIETEGYIKKISENRSYEGKNYKAYDNFQSEISFIPKDLFENTEKLKGNMYTKYKPYHIDGYKYIYENGDMLVYESVKYSDKSTISVRTIAQEKFLRLDSKGKLSIYTYYNAPPAVMSGSDYIRKRYEEAEEAQVTYRRADSKESPKMIEFVSIEKELADCPQVVEKYKRGDYGVGEKVKSKFLKTLNKVSNNDQVKYAALMEYNSGICDNNEESSPVVEEIVEE